MLNEIFHAHEMCGHAKFNILEESRNEGAIQQRRNEKSGRSASEISNHLTVRTK